MTTKASRRFNKQVDCLLNDLKTIFPEEKQLSVAQAQIESCKLLNQDILVEGFVQHVHQYKDQIMKKDEQFFLTEGNVKEQDYLSQALELRNLWKTKLREENKNLLWKYLQVMVLIADQHIKEKK
jgi:hypothetical protein